MLCKSLLPNKVFFPLHQLIRFAEGSGMVFIDGTYQRLSDLKDTRNVLGDNYLFQLVMTPCVTSLHLTWTN